MRLKLKLGEGLGEGCTAALARQREALAGEEGAEDAGGEDVGGEDAGGEEGGEGGEVLADAGQEDEHHHPPTTTTTLSQPHPPPHPDSTTPHPKNRKRDREQIVYYVQSSNPRSRYGSHGHGSGRGSRRGDVLGAAGAAGGVGGAGVGAGAGAGGTATGTGIGGLRGAGTGGIAAPSYEVRTKAWSCSCKGFAFEAFSKGEVGEGYEDYENIIDLENENDEEKVMLLDEDEGADEKDGNEWRWGGLMLQENDVGDVPLCKHLLACVLAEHWDVAGGLVVERVVGREEMGGWAAGWGD